MRFSFLYAAFIFSLLLGLMIFVFPWTSIQASFSTPALKSSSLRNFSFPFWEDPLNDPCYQLSNTDSYHSVIRDLKVVRNLGQWLFGLQGTLWGIFVLVHRKELGRGFRLPLLIAYFFVLGSVALVVLLTRSGGPCLFGPMLLTPTRVGIVEPSLAMLIASLGVTVAGIFIPCWGKAYATFSGGYRER